MYWDTGTQKLKNEPSSVGSGAAGPLQHGHGVFSSRNRWQFHTGVFPITTGSCKLLLEHSYSQRSVNLHTMCLNTIMQILALATPMNVTLKKKKKHMQEARD